MKFPTHYNQDDESVEDAEYVVIAHPFVGIGIDREEKHEIGRMISASLNAWADSASGAINAATVNVPVNGQVTGTSAFQFPASMKSLLSDRHKKMLDRKERALKKFVQKMTAKYSEPV